MCSATLFLKLTIVSSTVDILPWITKLISGRTSFLVMVLERTPTCLPFVLFFCADGTRLKVFTESIRWISAVASPGEES